MKKAAVLLMAFFAATGFAFADDLKISFYNKIFTEDAVLFHHEFKDNRLNKKHKDTDSDFPAIKEKMYAEIMTERVDAMVEITASIDDYDDRHFGIDGDIDDYYIEFRPIHPITLGLHTSIFAGGSLLPIYDDNVWAGNIGSYGFTTTWRPSVLKDALRVAVTVPFNTIAADSARRKNWLNGSDVTGYHYWDAENWDDYYDEDDFLYEGKFDVGLGLIYDHGDYLQVGFSAQDIADPDERQIGVFVDLPGLFGILDNLTIGGGFAHSERPRVAFDDLISIGHDEVSIRYRSVDQDGEPITVTRIIESCARGLAYENLLTSYLKMEFDNFNLTAEMLYNFKEDPKSNLYNYDMRNIYSRVPDDFYGAASFGFGLAGFNATATGKLLKDLSKKGAKAVHFGGFYLDYDINKSNSVGAGVEADICDKDWHLALPLYWKYSFER